MAQPTLPSIVLHHILNNYRNCYDQLIFAKVFHQYLVINDRPLSTILRRARPTDLRQLSIQSMVDHDRYIFKDDRVTS